MFKSINNSIYEIITNLFNEKDRNSIIEPLICLVRLAILDFKPVGTKISIFNNKITYNEPNLLQGAVRWSNGDARDDLHNIFLPITKASLWYDVEKQDIKNIFKFSIRGLERLKRSYSRNSTINHSIQYYIDTLKGSLNASNKNEEVEVERKSRSRRGQETNNVEVRSRGDVEADSEGSGEDENNTIFNKLKGIWNDREISIINNLLIEMETRRGTSAEQSSLDSADSETIILTLETLLSSKENRVSDLIIRSTTLLE
jgi:hypothetical protein